jgi:hypothetical protein
MNDSDRPTRGDRSITPESRVKLTIVQVVAIVIAIGGFSFSVGSLYPRLFTVEATVADLQRNQRDIVVKLERVTTILDQINVRPRRQESHD